jgi:adenylate kinase
MILKELGYALDAVLLLKIDEEVLVGRLSNRRTCRSCGKIWSVLTMAPGTTACPECKGGLYRRDDDEESVIRSRLVVYHQQTAPLIGWYEKKGKLCSVHAANSPEDTFKKIQAVLSQ